MGLKNMSLLANATVAASGGTALVFADDGVTIQNGVHLVVPADADYATRRQATVKYRPPTVDPKTGLLGKDKKSISFVCPQQLADGRVVYNTVRIEREVHPEFPAASATDMNKVASQLLYDTDTDNFWGVGSLS